MRVAGLGYRDGARNLEVMLESLSGRRRREIQEDGIVMEVKKNYLSVLTIIFIYHNIMAAAVFVLNSCNITSANEIMFSSALVS